MTRWFRRAPLLLLAGVVAAQDAKQTRDLADGLYAREMYELASGEYRKLLAAHPGYAQRDVVYYRLAEAAMRLKQPAEAEPWYAKLTAEFPDSQYAARALLRRGELQLNNKQYDQALVQFAGVLQRKPGGEIEAGAQYFSGVAHAALNRAALASKHFKAVTIEHTDSGYLSLACLEYARLIEKQPGQEAELQRLYRLAIRKPANDAIGAEARFQLANLLYRAKDHAASAAAFEELFRAYPDSPRCAEARLTAAWAHYHHGAHQAALDTLQAMGQREILQAAAEWTYLKANTLRSLKRHDEAIPSYERLIATAPNSPFTRNARYELLLIRYERKEYEAVLEQTGPLSQDPELKEDALWLQAQAQQSLKRGKEAATTFARIAAEFPATDRAPEALFSAAQMFQDAGDDAQAAATYERYAATYTTNSLAPRAWYAAGLAHLKRGDGAAAGRAWNHLATQFPDHELVDDALFQKAATEIRTGDKPAAVATLADLLKRRPDSEHRHDARFYLAAMLDELDKTADAERAYRDLVAAKPPSPMLEQAQHRLGLNCYRQAKYDEAARALVPVLATEESRTMSPRLLIWLAQHLHRQKQWKPAIEAARRVANPPVPDRDRQLAWWVVGGAEEALGNAGPAAEAYTQALAIKLNTRESTEAALRLGALQLAAKRFAEARQAFNIASSAASKLGRINDQARGYFGLGEVARAEGNWNDAGRYFMSVGVLFDDPELTPDALRFAGEAFGKAGKPEDQKKAWAELRQRYPDSEATKSLPPAPAP